MKNLEESAGLSGFMGPHELVVVLPSNIQLCACHRLRWVERLVPGVGKHWSGHSWSRESCTINAGVQLQSYQIGIAYRLPLQPIPKQKTNKQTVLQHVLGKTSFATCCDKIRKDSLACTHACFHATLQYDSIQTCYIANKFGIYKLHCMYTRKGVESFNKYGRTMVPYLRYPWCFQRINFGNIHAQVKTLDSFNIYLITVLICKSRPVLKESNIDMLKFVGDHACWL